MVKRHLQNARFNFRRNIFRMFLVLEPKVLPLFVWTVRLSVVAFIVLFLGLWLVLEPPVAKDIQQQLEPLPGEVEIRFLQESPFTELREFAPRPESISGSGELRLNP